MQKLDPSLGLSIQGVMDGMDAVKTAVANQCLTSAGLVIGSGSAAKVKIANTVTFLSGGVFKSKTTAEVPFTTTVHDIAPNVSTVQEAVYLLTLDGTGAPTLTMGAIATGTGNAKLPELPGGTVIGHVRVAVAAGSTPFAANSDVLSAGHLTVAYTNVGFVTPRFDIAQ